jgi:hypothetical protein
MDANKTTTISEHERWQTKVRQLEKDLETAKFKGTLNITNFESFNGALEHIFRRYSRLPVATFVAERLAPHFDHLSSFEKAINVSVQQSAASSLVWSACLAIIEVSHPLSLPCFWRRVAFMIHCSSLVCLPSCKVYGRDIRPAGAVLPKLSCL